MPARSLVRVRNPQVRDPVRSEGHVRHRSGSRYKIHWLIYRYNPRTYFSFTFPQARSRNTLTPSSSLKPTGPCTTRPCAQSYYTPAQTPGACRPRWARAPRGGSTPRGARGTRGTPPLQRRAVSKPRPRMQGDGNTRHVLPGPYPSPTWPEPPWIFFRAPFSGTAKLFV